MPDLRDKVIEVICEEWKHADNKVSSVSIQARLQSKGESAAVEQVEQVLFQLRDNDDLTLYLDPGEQSRFVVERFNEGLCPPGPRKPS